MDRKLKIFNGKIYIFKQKMLNKLILMQNSTNKLIYASFLPGKNNEIHINPFPIDERFCGLILWTEFRISGQLKLCLVVMIGTSLLTHFLKLIRFPTLLNLKR